MRSELVDPLKKENHLLKSQLHKANAQIKNLKRNLKKFQTQNLPQVELDLLHSIADLDVENAFEITLAEEFQLSKAELDFHLTNLTRAGYVRILFIDPVFGENFQITQKGRQVLFKRNLI